MEAWSFSSTQYVKAAINNVEKYLREKKKTNLNMAFPKVREAPISSNFRPELGKSETLDEVDAVYYQSLKGVLKWIVCLGHVNINVEVLMLSFCLALSRFGHLQ